MSVRHTDARGSGYEQNVWIGTPTAAMRVRSKKFREGKKLPTPAELVKMWPTPNAVVVECSPEHWLERRERFKRGESKFNPGLKLETAVHMWPTPTVGVTEGGEQSDRVEKTKSGGYILRKKNKPDNTFGAKLSDAVLFEEKKMWPTPTARDHKDSGDNLNLYRNKRQDAQLGVVTKRTNPTGGQLNPTWVEWLMGWPIGWTDLKPLETDRFQEWLQQHGGF
jgi:DNA (cytosine-5)-methyltransferase 1